MLSRIYGLYSIKTNIFGPLTVIVMENTAVMYDSENGKMKFDIKGSTIGRKTHLPYK